MAEARANPNASDDALVEDRALLLAFHRGSDEAARKLWTRHAGALRVYACGLVGDAGADDVVQGVFLGILKMRRKALREVRCPAAWLCTLTRRAALNDRRAASRASRHEAMGLGAGPSNPPAMDVHELLDAAPQECRDALVLRHAYGFTLERLAEALGVSRSTAADRYARGLAFARERLAEEPAKGEAQHVG